MSISLRTARTSRYVGVAVASAALVFGAAGNAMACSIKDFSAVAACDGDKGVIRVTDVDPLGVEAEVTVYLENNGADLRQVGSRTITDSTADGVTITFEEDWEPKAEYRVHITAENYVDDDIKPNLIAPAKACGTKADTPPAASKGPEKPSDGKGQGNGKDKGKGEGEGEDEPSETRTSPTPSASEGTTPVGSNDNNAPSPEGDSSLTETGGDSNLAETGSDANTGPIAGAAAALVALGAGAVYYSMRRRGASTR
ncbi:LAETG motif-containing sortase-dependent surface protein [Streptomyces stelliscabiei]|uniref:LAETG motif-containing sortase-dependent surface protein n=1 Tax=Streptomyces stelliscabiei TaxID=146820 RepID=UPI0029B1DA86|nr:LAETG motif-containing sortase-dependent surface protein [Streptomyces stelliscabiei]MDX2554374.1 LAETG motif-containing sortase-dependent surface protein [Streptomyces stelliscabiei]MDX2613583.1 LAETG motif-containing sortase-dependent surface protein [Streptomyces stelliscabiei]MDX2639178.1 LAETG motif-containing sortase-dependent surface protein [Streptomyces stelliscabiei]MDX2663058.1 LAETG motif-containing sortase-dependent surface protein [Streptomyces stelliscabiei]MDX2717439.1 LAETG